MTTKYYAVARGLRPGIYTSWTEVQPLVSGFVGAIHKSFKTLEEATLWISETAAGQGNRYPKKPITKTIKESLPVNHTSHKKQQQETTLVYSDGSSLGNPGPGGYGVVIKTGEGQITELSGGYKITTNNRMELMGCIVALRELAGGLNEVILHTDSIYVVNGIMKGWAKKWRSNNWIKGDKKPAVNQDLWSELLELTERPSGGITLRWIKGHAGHIENERCDRLANEAAAGADLMDDTGYPG